MTIVVSLTTIPSRLSLIQPVIDSILAQSVSPDIIELYIPRVYRRIELGVVNESDFPQRCKVMRCDVDYGPATKIVPALEKYKDKQDVVLIYCDDDRLYERRWIERLLEGSKRHPGACIAEQGFKVSDREAGITNRPSYKPSILKKLKDIFFRRSQPTQVDVAEGYGGVLVRPSFFDSSVKTIPDVFWAVDDIWLSGKLAEAGVPIYKTKRRKRAKSRPLVANQQVVGEEVDSLKHSTIEGHTRDQADLACIEYFRQRVDSWRA